MVFQIFLSYIYRRNSTEISVRTWKNHFIAVLCGVVNLLPMQLCICLVHQAHIKSNLLFPERSNPKLSAHATMGGGGGGNFNKTLLEPLGTKVIVHLKPDKKITGSSCSGWVVPCTRHGTLYMLQGICHNN